MMGDGYSGWWVPGLLFMGFCMVMMFWMMSGHGSHASQDDATQGQAGDVAHLGRPELILAERLARGEIEVEEYERLLRVLRNPGEVERA